MLKRTHCLRQKLSNVPKYIPPSQQALAAHEAYSKKQKRSVRWGKIIQYGALSLVGGAVLMYFWQPWNPYSTNVSRELRRGLRQEQEGKEDYLQALKYYQNALQTAKTEEDNNQLSLKYTGIVLKVAEMYEKLGMKERVLETYLNLGTFIFENLIHESPSIPDNERDLLIDRDLIVMTRWAMLQQELKPGHWFESVDTELTDRISFIEQGELVKRLPWLLEGGKQIDVCELIKLWSGSGKQLFLPNREKNKWVEENIESLEGQTFLKSGELSRFLNDLSWPCWVNSYLKLRDFYAMLQMSKGNLPICIQYLQSNLLWTCIGDFEDSVNIPTQIANIGSAWFQYGQNTNDKHAYDHALKIFQCLNQHVKPNDPILPISYYSIGIIHLQRKEMEQALESFEMSRNYALELGQVSVLDNIDDALIKDTV